MFTQNRLIAIFITLGVIAVGILIYSFVSSSPTSGTQKTNSLFSALFPFGSTPQTTTTTTLEDTKQITGEAPELRHVTEKAVSGGGFVGTSTIRYMERETGHVYETSSNSLEQTRITNTTIPGIQELMWGNKGFFIARFIDDADILQTLYGTVASSTPEQTLAAQPGPSYTFGTLAPDNSILWTVTNTNDGSHADLIDIKTMKPKTIYSSPLRSWTPLASNNEIFLLSSPSAVTSGSLYKVEKDTRLNKIIGDKLGLTASVSPSGRYILYTYTTGTGITTWLHDREQNKEYKIPLATLPEKCAWIPKNEPQLFCGVPGNLPVPGLPDAWYLGLVSFTDRAWLIDPVQSVVKALNDLSYSENQTIDVSNPTLSSDGTTALFMNKNDLSLWSLKLR